MDKKSRGILFVVLAVGLLTALTATTLSLNSQKSNDEKPPVIQLPEKSEQNPKLSSALNRLLSSSDKEKFAKENKLYVESGKVRVVIGFTNQNFKLPKDYGIEESRIEAVKVMQAMVKIDRLADLVKQPEVRYIEEPKEIILHDN